jgi:hypothetical protein
MPRRAQRAHRDRLEAEASASTRALLREFREACALGPDWQAVEPLNAALTHLVCMQLAKRLRDGGLREAAALKRAAEYLGVPAETIRTHHERWYRASRALEALERPKAKERQGRPDQPRSVKMTEHTRGQAIDIVDAAGLIMTQDTPAALAPASPSLAMRTQPEPGAAA